MRTCWCVVGLVVAIVPHVPVDSSKVNPISQAIQMLSKLEREIIQEGDEAHKMYDEFADMCGGRSRELRQEIKSSKASLVELSGTIEKAAADIMELDEKISDTTANIADTENELKKATAIRSTEMADFKAEEKELMRSISAIERATSIIERDGSKDSLAQVQRASSVTAALAAMADASAMNSEDSAKLVALVQSSSDMSFEEDADDPSPAASGTILETLGSLLEKTQKSLEKARNAEMNAVHSYSLLKSSLEAKIKTLGKELSEAKKSTAELAEKQASAEGVLVGTKKDLNEDEKELAELHHECIEKATSYQEATVARSEELKALAQAKKIILESTSGAAEQTYDFVQTSFLQLASKGQSLNSDALRMVSHLAMKYPSGALIELSNHIQKTLRLSAMRAKDPFNKVKALIVGMVNKLEAEAENDATKKVYCDKEITDAEKSQQDKEDRIEQLRVQNDVVAAESKKLKAQVKRLQKETADLMRTQAEMDKLRVSEKTVYEKNKPIMEQGLEGVKRALVVLRDYYAQDGPESAGPVNAPQTSGAGVSIIGLLEVVESDFSKSLAEMTSSEEFAQSEYEKVTRENKNARDTKAVDIAAQTKQYVSFDKTLTELVADKSGVESELDAVNQYLASLQKECHGGPDSYKEIKNRRDAQIAGLKEALDTLEGESVLLQTKATHRALRGTAHANPWKLELEAY